MKKLKLEIENVQVESFDTTAAERQRKGTVLGHITAAVSCYDTDCCTPNATCPDSHYTGPCECATQEVTCRPQASCVYSCIPPCP